jgi:hypothetical protein
LFLDRPLEIRLRLRRAKVLAAFSPRRNFGVARVAGPRLVAYIGVRQSGPRPGKRFHVLE